MNNNSNDILPKVCVKRNHDATPNQTKQNKNQWNTFASHQRNSFNRRRWCMYVTTIFRIEQFGRRVFPFRWLLLLFLRVFISNSIKIFTRIRFFFLFQTVFHRFRFHFTFPFWFHGEPISREKNKAVYFDPIEWLFCRKYDRCIYCQCAKTV